MSSLASEEHHVEAHSASLKKELGLRDLVLQQIVFVVGVIWVGTAAKLGHSQAVFWLAAIVFFYVPQAMVVIDLTRRMPLEGGPYQWARLGLGELMGFMVAWNLWLFAVVLIATVGLVVATNLSYAVGPSGAWMGTNKTFIMVLNAFLLAALIVLAGVGLGVAKWLHNTGSIMLMLAFAVMIALPFAHMARGTLPDYHPFAIAMPALSLFSLNVFGKLAMGALSGFEYVAILAGETKNPERTIGRATMIAAPIIAAMFILGTSAVLAFVPIDQINLIGPIPQVLSIGFGASRLGTAAAAIAILLITGRTIANFSVIFTSTTRMPMVAGWDNLLPKWFTTLHPRFRTPLNSILFVGLVATAFGAVGIAGVGEQEAFQILENASGIFYGLTYLVMFAIPIIGLRNVQPAPPLWLRMAAASGFAVTLLYVVLSIFPIIDVTSWLSFAAKISGVVVGLNAVGVALYWNATRRRASRGPGNARMITSRVSMFALAVALSHGGAVRLAAQRADTTGCDSIVGAARVDTVPTGIFVSVRRTDGEPIPSVSADLIASTIGAAFIPPKPFRLTVFSGPARLRVLRALAADTTPNLRAPTVTGAYRFTASPSGPATARVVRASLMPGFDSAAIGAIVATSQVKDVFTRAYDMEQIPLEIRFSSDSIAGARRIISATFPRMPTVDAVPNRNNPAPVFPDSEKPDSLTGTGVTSAEVVLRFVVDRAGVPRIETVEVERNPSLQFLRAALTSLLDQRFSPATIHGCAVAQRIDYAFSFVLPDTIGPPRR